MKMLVLPFLSNLSTHSLKYYCIFTKYKHFVSKISLNRFTISLLSISGEHTKYLQHFHVEVLEFKTI